MSLINEMLRNLETKGAEDLSKLNFQREIRPLLVVKQKRGRWFWVTTLGLVMLLLTGFAAVQHRAQLRAMLGFASETPPLAPLAPPVVTAQVPPEPVVVTATTTESTAGPRVDSEKTLISDSLLVARELAFVPQSPEMLSPAISPVAGMKSTEPVLPKPAVDKLAVDSVRTGVASGSVKIDKSPVLATPRDRAELDYRKAETAASEGRTVDSVELLKTALKIDPAHIQARQVLIRLLLEARKQDEAMHVLNEGLELMPSQIGWAVSLARLQMEHGELAAADRTLIHSQAFAENNAEYAGFQGHLKSRLGDNRQAAEYYLRAARIAPREGRWSLGLGLAFEADGRIPESKEAFRRSVASGNLTPELAAVAEQRLR
jgi:MSHA biogenesis protein MshN